MSDLRTPPPYLSMYPGDILRDTFDWTGEQRALLVVLMLLSFIKKLPANEAELARIVQYNLTTFQSLWPTVSTAFVVEDGQLLHARVEAARVRADQIRKKRKSASKKGVEAKKAKQVIQSGATGGNPRG